MSTPQAAAIYARISSDPDGTALGVGRQLEDCRRRAAESGWVVAEEYVDNDISAYSGKRRPAYERMLVDLAEGRRDGVLCYHNDRLTRKPIELEVFLDIVGRAGVTDVQFVAGGVVDLANGDGLTMLRVMGAIAAGESSTKSRRQKRKMDQVAEAGMPHGGSIRPFGFEPDRITHRAAEAEVVRELVARYLAGESIRSLTVWLDAEGVPTVSGKPWNTTTVQGILRSERNAGLRVHHGDTVPAVWAPIVSIEDRDRVLARMAERVNAGRRTPQRYLLSGMCRCGKCGNRLYSSVRQRGQQRVRRYVCMSGPDHGGCGKLTIVAPPLEELVTAAVLFRLDSPELADTIAGRVRQDEHASKLSEAIAVEKALLDELAGLYGENKIRPREWMAARNPIELRLRDLDRELTAATGAGVLAGIAGQGAQLGAQWADLSFDRHHAIVAAVIDHVAIGPGVVGARNLDPGRVDIVWRV